MIRDTDKWANTSERLYISPLSHFCSDYGDFVRKQERSSDKTPYIYPATTVFPEDTPLLREMRTNFAGTVQSVSGILDNICKGEDDMFPAVNEMMQEKNVLSALFSPRNAHFCKEMADLNNPEQKELVIAIAIAGYLLSKVRFIALATNDEDYAFDIFESLNTTGQLLTAYETFKPEMVRAETLPLFNGSESARHAKEIEANIRTSKSPGKFTADLMVSFALAESGKKISKALRDQRNYMRDEYKRIKDTEEKRLFTRHLMHASQVSGAWFLPKKTEMILPAVSREFQQEWKEARFCLNFIRKANHSIARGLMTRFHEAVQISEEGEREEKIRSFCRVVKAIAAFFALWRGSRSGTDGIDAKYRDMMKGVEKLVDPFSRRGGGPVSDEQVRRAFRHFLEEGGNSKKKITSREKWVEYAVEIPVYRGAQAVAKFLLLVASEGAAPSEKPGMLEKTPREGAFVPMIDEFSWDSKDYDTIEHVIAQSDQEKLHCNVDKLHRLGNLTLLPQKANSLIGSDEWGKKRLIYRALSATTKDELNKAIHAPGFPKKHRKSKILMARHLPMTAALAKCDSFKYQAVGDGIIERRGENLAKLAWKRLAEDWLKWR